MICVAVEKTSAVLAEEGFTKLPSYYVAMVLITIIYTASSAFLREPQHRPVWVMFAVLIDLRINFLMRESPKWLEVTSFKNSNYISTVLIRPSYRKLEYPMLVLSIHKLLVLYRKY